MISNQPIRVAEFFAGIGLVRSALEAAQLEVVWANDIAASKEAIYDLNFDSTDFKLGDVRDVVAEEIPDVDLYTASFPCTDLSLAGGRDGLSGDESSLLWEFVRVLDEAGSARPKMVLLENVAGLVSSRNGQDLRDTVEALNDLGYVCDVFQVDAKDFVPQSRLRVFVVGTQGRVAPLSYKSQLRSAALSGWISKNDDLELQTLHTSAPRPSKQTLSSVVEKLDPSDLRWWSADRVEKFEKSLSPLQLERLTQMKLSKRTRWRTAYRRTRAGVAVWEIRRDEIAGCLRTARGGSSRQALVEAGRGELRVRWLTGREYARLQGAKDFSLDGIRDTQIVFGFGDAVCVPVIEWIAKSVLIPAISEMDRNLLAA